MPIISAIVLDPETITLLSVILSALVTAIIVLWRTDVAQRERHLDDMRALRNEAQRQRDELVAIIIERGMRDVLPPHLSPPAAPATGSGVHRPIPRTGLDH